MPLDYPPELVCTAYCDNVECGSRVAVCCQHGDYVADVEAKLRHQGWIADRGRVFCSEACRRSHVSLAALLAAPAPWRDGR